MPTVEVRFSALPAHVRTARLVALAVARRTGMSPDLVDEVRLAVGEACSRAVGLNATREPDAPVTLLLEEQPDRFIAEIVNVGPLTEDPVVPELDTEPADALADAAVADAASPEALPDGFRLAVIGGLVDAVEVQDDDSATRVRLTWPLPAKPID
jgi:anti-sigma regulatory factor (Ser/Thr protein kinase)